MVLRNVPAYHEAALDTNNVILQGRWGFASARYLKRQRRLTGQRGKIVPLRDGRQFDVGIKTGVVSLQSSVVHARRLR